SFKVVLDFCFKGYLLPRRTSTIFRTCNKLDVVAIRFVAVWFPDDLNFWGQSSPRFVHSAGI
ncbi:hypothetical protein, partial [Desulfobacula sp.]|uniref:hypothetical protein n=1 Tax=Desulfobacula sp. TaxID=2593537 RepID=UPI0025C1CF43